MIRVTVELVPYGIGKPKHLGTAIIYNDGSGTKQSGNYKFKLSRRGQPETFIKSGEVKNFPRLRKNAWHLLHLVLKEVLEHE